MSFSSIKQIPIKGYLAAMGIHPAKEYGVYGMYRHPFREEQTASFKVDYSRNLWHDFGTGEGGSIVDLVMRMEQCSAYQAACKLEHWEIGTYQHSNQSFHQSVC